MSSDQERDLPRAVWSEAVPSTTNSVPASDNHTVQAEFEEWTRTFSVLGWDVRVAMQQNVGRVSSVLGKPMLTYEDVYRHLSAGGVSSPVETPVLEPASTAEQAREDKRRRRDARNKRIDEARNAWREAVAQRKLALAQWDAYVAHLHSEFVRTRDERDHPEG